MSKEEIISLKVLMKMINYALSQIVTFDDDLKGKIAGLDEVIEWKVGDIKYSTVIKDGNIYGADVAPSKPSLSFEIADVGTALKLLTGRIDMSNALNSVTIKGDAAKAQSLTFILEKASEYLGDIT